MPACIFRGCSTRVRERWGSGGAGRAGAATAHAAARRACKRTYADRVLAVGDAAGLVKPTTGGGIYYSVVSGEIAAEVLGDAAGGERSVGERRCANTSGAGAAASNRSSRRSWRCASWPSGCATPTSTRCSRWRRPTASCRWCGRPRASTGIAISSSRCCAISRRGAPVRPPRQLDVTMQPAPVEHAPQQEQRQDQLPTTARCSA